MDIGIGLPSTIIGTSGPNMVQWARAAEQAGFTSVAVTDRVLYDNYDPFVALSGAAAVTDTIRLVTAVLLGPIRQTALMAKAAASLDRLSEGRLELGLGVGNRPDDYAAGEADFHRRGRTADAQLVEMLRVWRGEVRGVAGTLGPAPHSPDGPPLLFGGTSPATWRRTAQYGQGWICGVGGPELFAAHSKALVETWQGAGRKGTPRRVMLRYFSLGANGPGNAEAFIRSCYAMAPFRDDLIATTPTSPAQVTDLVAAYIDVGCDELLLFPCSSSAEQVGLLAEAVGDHLVRPSRLSSTASAG